MPKDRKEPVKVKLINETDGLAHGNDGHKQAQGGTQGSSIDIMKESDSESSLPISKNALKVLERRYLRRSENNELIETPEDMFRRVAKNIASADLKFNPSADLTAAEEEFYGMMTSLAFLPNSPTLMNAGRELQQLSACFVLPVDDSMDSIFEAIKNTAMIHKSGGGTGFSFSRLRPASSRVASTNGVSSGPITFMKVFDAATEAIKQGGTRRGANMGILRVDHPDILDFILSKQSERGLNNFNISVAVTERFMEAVEKNSDYDLVDPHTRRVVKRLNAKHVFRLITQSAWKTGDPGIVFIDRINRDNPTPHIGEIESTNPCGEQPLLPYESCNLGSINLSALVTEDGRMDYQRLRKTVHTAVHFLDNVIEMNKFPLPEIEKMTKANRKIGLGVMGFSDMLIKMAVPYDTDQAIRVAEEVMELIDIESKLASQKLGDARGHFPNYKGSMYDKPGARSIRNATTTTIAPTGTISIIAGVSSGIEPLFAVSFVRTVMDGTELVEVNPLFEKIARDRGFYSEELMLRIAHQGHLKGIQEVPEDIRQIFPTSHTISPEWHIRMQAAFQKYCDNAVSKTVNFANSASIEDIHNAYILAYHLGCKGVTIYRDGCRSEQVLSTGSTREAAQGTSATATAPAGAVAHKITSRPRPVLMRGVTQRLMTGCGNIYVTINEDEEGRPFEIFTQIGKAGGCAASQTESISRLVSQSLRSGVDCWEIIQQLRGVSCHQPAWDSGSRILSCADAIAKAMTTFITERDKLRQTQADAGAVSIESKPAAKEETATAKPAGAKPAPGEKKVSAGACPDCGSTLEMAEGCQLCRTCGYSKC